MKLVQLNDGHYPSFLKMAYSFYQAGEGFKEYKDYSRTQFMDYLAKMEREKLAIDYQTPRVPQIRYWAVDEEKNLLGLINFRPILQDNLLIVGGHIGYKVAPFARSRGLASFMLAKVLRIAREYGLATALLTTDYDNIASQKVILKNGGVFKKKVFDEGEQQEIHHFHVPLIPKDENGILQFGKKETGATYRDRPGSYVVLIQNGKVGIVQNTTIGNYLLAGGGIDHPETAEQAGIREALEETGLEIKIDQKIGEANGYVFSPALKGHFNKLGQFFTASIVGHSPEKKVEADHVLLWEHPIIAIEKLTQPSHRWAVIRALERG